VFFDEDVKILRVGKVAILGGRFIGVYFYIFIFFGKCILG
jgi:hypothetical protein